MSTVLELVPVAASVGAIISAYHDGAELLAQIRAKRKFRAASVDNATLQELTSRELQSSLDRGAQVVQSQFDRDASRFGEQYTTGDRIACHALKDVIIHLQSQMIVDLKIQSYQETIADFSALQDVAEISQDQVVMVLLQLQQRVIMASPIEATEPLPWFWDSNPSSTQSQHHTSIQNVDAPYVTAALQPNQCSDYPPAPQYNDNLLHSSDIPSSGASGPLPRSENDTKVISQVSPVANGISTPPPPPPPHSNTPPPPRVTASSSGPEEKTTYKSRTSIFGSLGRHRKNSAAPYSSESVSRTSSTPIVPQYLIPGKRGDQSPSGTNSQRPFNHRTSTAASISTQTTSELPSSMGLTKSRNDSLTFRKDQAEIHPWNNPDNNLATHTNQDAQSSISSNTSRTSQDTHSVQSFKQPIVPSTITIITAKQEPISAKDLLPCEANKYSGFCKGAWRLQIGDYKKALQERQRPGSMYSAVRFWQCIQCNFEGRLVQQDKKTKDFDQQVMLADGIQFRWVFLFKSHVECKNANSNPLRSTFGCMFCCAEGRGTPVFEGAQNLMNHLQEHRVRLPAGEVLYRMNCLIGTRAPVEADFDINLVAKEGIRI
ncbi:MAG: hypothetical protein Q9224_004177 [Gallowayella concinna]